MKAGAPGSFGAHLKALRVAAGFTQEELATIAGLSVHAVSALERGERKRPHVDTVRALAAALDLEASARDALVKTARVAVDDGAADELGVGSLPLALTGLLGRDADVQALRQWLRNRGARLITLVGPGGVGKTRLALEIARGLAEDAATRVAFVELATIRDPAFVAPAIAEALGLSDVAALDLPRRVRAACDERRSTLLVLDNCEQVLDAAPLVVDLLTSAPSLRLLATSRAPLRLRGERLYAVGPLELQADPDLASPAELARNPAVRLFVERVRDVQPDFRLTPANGPTVTAICRRLDALPLALELAAPWIKVLTAEDLLRRLERDVLLPTVAPRDLPERQQTMSTTVAWSYQLLHPDEQRAFRRFGALPGRFPIEAAAAVLAGGSGFPAKSDDALGAAAALMEKSLLHRVETSAATRPLYQMLETVRAYAGLELAAMDERDDALEGLARYCVSEAEGAAAGLIGPEQIEWLDRVRDDLHNYRGALAWLIERGRVAEAADIAWGLLFFWLIRGRTAEGLQWYQLILGAPDLPPGTESRAHIGAAVMSYTRGDPERTRTAVLRAMAIARGAADAAIIAHGENLLGHIEQAAGHVHEARDLFVRSVEGFKRLAIPWGAGNALIGLAGVALATGDADNARRLLDEATSVLRQAGPWFQNMPLYVHAIEAVRRGDADAAIALADESLRRSRKLKDRFAFVYALVPLAAAAVLKGNDAWAARILGARDALTERAGATVASNSVRDLRQHTERQARARLGPERWGRAYAAGRTASIDGLLKDIESGRSSA
jgi:predicted ATPase/DNA-binding XRE family transcriptional regulator